MRNRTGVLGLVALLLVVGAVCLAADNPAVGTWKLNESKSKIPAGTPKNDTVIVAVAGGNMTVTVQGVDGSGKAVKSEWTGKFDGKDYPVTGDATIDARSYKQINENTLELTNKKDGKVLSSGRAVISADGKTRTVTIKGKDSTGKEVKSVAVYEKQ